MSRRAAGRTPVYDDPCIYQPDPDTPAPLGGEPPCVCHLPKRHPRHQLPTTPGQAEHRRRAGDHDEEDL
jgi:hypothetical protein